MTQVAPPEPPRPVRPTFDDGLHRVQFRLWQVLMTALTLAVMCWFMTFGVFSTIIAVLVAKHVLVAILAAGLNLPETTRRKPHPA